MGLLIAFFHTGLATFAGYLMGKNEWEMAIVVWVLYLLSGVIHAVLIAMKEA